MQLVVVLVLVLIAFVWSDTSRTAIDILANELMLQTQIDTGSRYRSA